MENSGSLELTGTNFFVNDEENLLSNIFDAWRNKNRVLLGARTLRTSDGAKSSDSSGIGRSVANVGFFK